MIYVCPLLEDRGDGDAEQCAPPGDAAQCRHPGHPSGQLAAEDHLILSMNDITVEQADMTLPGEAHVQSLLDFAREWDRTAPLVIHCFAGISRSTAAAYSVAAALAPKRDEAELAATLRRLSPSATPNARLIAIADRLLGRQGRMIAAIESIGRGADAFEGVPFALKIDG